MVYAHQLSDHDHSAPTTAHAGEDLHNSEVGLHGQNAWQECHGRVASHRQNHAQNDRHHDELQTLPPLRRAIGFANDPNVHALHSECSCHPPSALAHQATRDATDIQCEPRNARHITASPDVSALARAILRDHVANCRCKLSQSHLGASNDLHPRLQKATRNHALQEAGSHDDLRHVDVRPSDGPWHAAGDRTHGPATFRLYASLPARIAQGNTMDTLCPLRFLLETLRASADVDPLQNCASASVASRTYPAHRC